MLARLSLYRLLTIALSLLSTVPAVAQQRNMQPHNMRNQGMNQGMMPMMSKPIKGTLISASANQLQIATDSKQTIYAMVGQNTKVSVTGTAEREYLKPGLAVEFVAEVAKGGAVKDKIDHLTLVTITGDRPAGLLPPEIGAAEKKGGKGDKGEKAQAAPIGGGDDLLSSKPGKTAKAHSGAPQLPGTYTVRGTLKMSKNGAITVAAGRGPTVRAELSDSATIDVDVTDLRTAQRDDTVTVRGMGNPTRPNMIMAESVTIELANPLTGKKHAKPAKAAAVHGKAKKDAGEGDALPDGK
jgi:hypothetical protein